MNEPGRDMVENKRVKVGKPKSGKPGIHCLFLFGDATMATYLDEPTAPDEALDGLARPYQEFLEDNTFNYQDDIIRMLNLDQTRLIIDLDHLRAYKKELATAYVSLSFLFIYLSNNHPKNTQRTIGAHSSLWNRPFTLCRDV